MKLIIPQRIDAASPVPGTGLTDNHFLDFNIMSDYYNMSSFELPASWPEAAKDEFVRIMKHLVAVYQEDEDLDLTMFPPGCEALTTSVDDYTLYMGGTVWDDKEDDPTVLPEDRRVGYYDTERFDLTNIQIVVQAIADKYAIPREKSCTISVAWTCSKPLVDAFGGTSVEIYARPEGENDQT